MTVFGKVNTLSFMMNGQLAAVYFCFVYSFTSPFSFFSTSLFLLIFFLYYYCHCYYDHYYLSLFLLLLLVLVLVLLSSSIYLLACILPSGFLFVLCIFSPRFSCWVLRHPLMGCLINPSRPGWWSDGWMAPFPFPFLSPSSPSSTLHIPFSSLFPPAPSILLFCRGLRMLVAPQGTRGRSRIRAGWVGSCQCAFNRVFYFV